MRTRCVDGGDVVALEPLVAGIVDQCARDAGRRVEVVNTPVLGKASAHDCTLRLCIQGRPVAAASTNIEFGANI